MAKEIEKKYLIREEGKEFFTGAFTNIYPSVEALKDMAMEKGKAIRQGYVPMNIWKEISDMLNLTVKFSPAEARLREKAGICYFTIKGNGGLFREEVEAKMPENLFKRYWGYTEGRRAEKMRFAHPYHGHTAEIDVYTDRDLIIAEIEVPSQKEAANLEPLGKDVTEDSRYKNKNLAR